MNRVFILLVIGTCLFSCKEKETINHREMFYMLNNDIDYQIIQITDNINDKKYNHKELIPQVFIEYDSLTNDYVKFVDNIIEDLTPSIDNLNSKTLNSKEVVNTYFFKDNSYTSKANEFIVKTELYREQILRLSANYFTRSRIKLTLNTKPIILEDDYKMSHLDFYFRDINLSTALLYFNNLKRKVLEYENYYLYDCLLKNNDHNEFN